MKRLSLLFLMVFLLLGSTGCGRHGLAVLGGVIVGAAIVDAASSHHHYGHYEHYEHETTYVYVNNGSTAYVNSPGAAALPRSTRDDPPDGTGLPAFDPTAARSALAAVELSKCSAVGAPRSYGHAIVTINPSGDISKVVVDEPGGMSAMAVGCIGDEIGKVRVAPFRGSLVNMGTTWYVP